MPRKQPRKQPVAKKVWEWTEEVLPENVTEEHVHTAYRLRLGKCKACRKTCVGNPLCHRGIGESYWLKPSNNNCLDDELNEYESLIRKDGEFVGLKNLGATCYVNTFLQLWFHNIRFRKAIYTYKEILKNDELFPQSATGHLQLIFGMLESSKRKNIDPTPFIQCLGLDTDLQQDAQEFSKLLLDLLNQNSAMGNVLCKEFCGEYEYSTTCKCCSTISKQPSKFYELDLSIQGHSSIEDCLKEFLQEELLEKDNQYSCGTCNCRQDATRQIIVKSLPRTLNLQLLRFVFDKTTYTKKKISRVLSFPDVLDLTPFVSSNGESIDSFQYDLTAVLIHRGPSAFSGHYIAHIKDTQTNLWHKFNDENVDRLKGGKKLNLDSPSNDDFEIAFPTPTKAPKLRKNCHSSKDAYMLVYTRREPNSPQSIEAVNSSVDIPEVVKKTVEKDNEDFFMTINTMIADSKKENERKSIFHADVRYALKDLYEMDASSLLASCRWVPTSWLKNALSNLDTGNEINVDKFMCSHSKLDPMKVMSLKCISKRLASIFCSTTESMNCDMICFDCVKQRCSLLRSKSSLSQDHNRITTLVKDSEDIEDGFYVGRYSLRCWKSMVCRRLETSDNTKAEECGEESSSDERICFNEDLLCNHGNLTLDLKYYRVIPCEAWHILLKYFPNAASYPTSSEYQSCPICLQDSQYAEQEIELKKSVVSDQKNSLLDLFHYRNRPRYGDLQCYASNDAEKSVFYGVNSNFVQQWRSFIRNPTKFDVVSSVNNQVLLCPHQKLIYNPISSFHDVIKDPEVSELVLLWSSEWCYISKNFIVDTVISISVVNDKPLNHMMSNVNGDSNITAKPTLTDPSVKKDAKEDSSLVTANILSTVQEAPDLKICPDICNECIMGKRVEKELSLRRYNDKIIYIKKVIPAEKDEWVKENSIANETNGRKRKRATTRGEKTVTVSSNWTLKQLKIQIMQLYSIPPFDQNLWIDGRKLEDDQATLESLAVLPETTLVVIADEPDESGLELLPVLPEKACMTEEGFKGTSLIGK